MTRRGVLRAVAVGLATLALGVPGLACGSEDQQQRDEVTAGDLFFKPTRHRAGTGGTVTWRNQGKQIHTVKGPGFFSRAIDPGGTYSRRFDRPGRYPYLCTLHPGMRGTIVVD